MFKVSFQLQKPPCHKRSDIVVDFRAVSQSFGFLDNFYNNFVCSEMITLPLWKIPPPKKKQQKKQQTWKKGGLPSGSSFRSRATEFLPVASNSKISIFYVTPIKPPFFGVRWIRPNGILSLPYPEVTLDNFSFPVGGRSAARRAVFRPPDRILARKSVFLQ